MLHAAHLVECLAIGAQPDGAVELRVVLVDRDDGQVRRFPVEEGVVVELGGRLTLSEAALVQQSRRGGIGDVEHRHLRAPGATLGRGVLADAQQEIATDRVQVRGVPEDLQLTDHARP